MHSLPCCASQPHCGMHAFPDPSGSSSNLEVLFTSYAQSGNSALVDIAVSHADMTLVNHVRPNESSFHVVEYNATTGEVIARVTAQEYSDNSTWGRGQAWGIHGFANSRLSPDLVVLVTSF